MGAVFSRKPAISLKRGKIGPRLLLTTNRIRAFDWCQNQRPWMTLKGITHRVSKHERLLEPTTKIWMKTRQWLDNQWRRCSPMTLDSDDIRFMRIFAGIPWKGDVIPQWQWGNRKRVFSGFRTLRIRHLRKWGQHYYIVLFSPLSPFHWPQNTWTWITDWLEGSFYVICSLLRTATD